MINYVDVGDLYFEVEEVSTQETVFKSATFEKASAWAKIKSENSHDAYLVTEEEPGITTRLEVWHNGVLYRP